MVTPVERDVGPRLDLRTQLVAGQQTRWSGRVFPTLGKAHGAKRTGSQVGDTPAIPAQPTPPELNAARCARRARARIQRYALHNGLNRLITLTYGGDRCTDRAEAMADGAAFVRRLKARGFSGPYVMVPELHADGIHYHLHFAFGRFIPKPVLAEIWGKGFVDVRQLRARKQGLKAETLAALYVAKYVAKSYGEGELAPGVHRYEVAEGFQPPEVLIEADTFDEFVGRCSAIFGGVVPAAIVFPEIEGAPLIVCIDFGGPSG